MKLIKSLFIASLFLLTTITPLLSQTANSIANGNWLNPLTWDCTCVPVDGYSVTVSHSVTFNTSLLFSSGGITVNNGASMIMDAANDKDLLVSGGYFVNNGTTKLRFFSLTSGSGQNNGSFSVTALTNFTPYVNNGTISMDSMRISSNFTNTSTGIIKGDSLTFASHVINNGRVDVTWSLNTGTVINNGYHGGYAFTNAKEYTNSDSLKLSYSIWNNSFFTNNQSGVVHLTKNFNNYHPSGTSLFINYGRVIVLDSWYNTDTVKGLSPGAFTVSDSTANTGFMKGIFSMCDLTPPSSAPFVDFNTGTIEAGITWCTATGLQSQNTLSKLSVYPNPSFGLIKIMGKAGSILKVISVDGRLVKEINLTNGEIEVGNLQAGIYFLVGEGIREKFIVLD